MPNIDQIVSILTTASKKLPQLKFAWGLLGIASVAALIIWLLGNSKAAIIVISLTIIGTVIVFTASIAFGNAKLALLPATVLIWSITIFFVIFLAFTVTAFALSWPCNWVKFLDIKNIECYPYPEAFLDINRTVDFSAMKTDTNGNKKDSVTFEDEIFFSDLPENGLYTREFQMPPGASLKVLDLVAGTEFTPSYTQGGTQTYGHFTFKIDKNSNKARLKWVYENAHTGDKEGVGFSSNNRKIRNVSVKYLLPNGKKICGNREFTPESLEQRCHRSNDGFNCYNLMISSEFRELWRWDVWNKCIN